MNEQPAALGTRYSLQARILGAVFVLVLAMYLATLAVLGLPLRDRAQQYLDIGAERELGAMMAAVQDHMLLRDYPSIEQAIRARALAASILSARFVSPKIAFETRTPPPMRPA